MDSKKLTLSNLQKALTMEIAASLQYQLHAAVLADWGLDLLAAKMKEEMSEETGHADEFLSRIIFLKASPKLELEKSPVHAKTLAEIFSVDLEDEKQALEFYTNAAKQAYEAGDLGSSALFQKIALDEEGHMAWLELQLDLLEKIGEANYMSKYISGSEE